MKKKEEEETLSRVTRGLTQENQVSVLSHLSNSSSATFN